MVEVIWGESALKQLNNVYDFIKRSSVQSAKKTRNEIFDVTDNLKSNPKVFPLDKYRKKIMMEV